MSSTFNDINQIENDYLVLDLGLYPASEDWAKQLLTQHKESSKILYITTNSMDDVEWDAVLDSILRAKRCITL